MPPDDKGHRIYGIHPVSACLRDGRLRIRCLYIREGQLSGRLEDILSLAESTGCPVQRMSAEALNDMAGKAHQGVVLHLDDMALLKEEVLPDIVERASGSVLLVVLDGVTDPRNLGACLRSAATMGAHGVVLPKDRSAPLNSAAIKTASGGAALVPVIQVVNLSRTLERLKRLDVWIVGMVLDGETALSAVDLTANTALVLGAEDKGLRQNTRKHCDYLARIPMTRDDPGFNVSVAAGICLYEAGRQRGLH
ncbi:MAG: 23S rRNA (guanosine(2251)-2'-O)-methyltransferase RlmB [Pseudomonadales bacterium]|nr:23S rRNA (guanosine(2251)-2'-O)-methyltransferase RlmB [Pseudomonadales bacterium]